MRTLISALACGLLLGGGLAAKHPGKGKGRGQDEFVNCNFRDSDRRIILSYYNLPSGLPPGLAKRDGDLPPGLEKQLRKKGQLPPGLQKRIEPFPAELSRQFPPLPDGARRGFISGRAVVYDSRTSIILDAMVIVPLGR